VPGTDGTPERPAVLLDQRSLGQSLLQRVDEVGVLAVVELVQDRTPEDVALPGTTTHPRG
jgi:hypothetical protein